MTDSTRGRDSVRPEDRLKAEFLAAYDAVLAKWPGAVESLDVTTPFGTTHVQVCGPADGTPLVLIPGGGATSTVWFANVGELSRDHRVYAIDPINDVGRSVPSGQPIRDRDGLMQWLDSVFTELGLDSAGLCGHSYGGWLALNYALHAPRRLSKLALIDPTDCFAGLRLGYRLRAIPALVRPNRQRMRALLEWETRGRSLDPAWLDLACIGSEMPRPKLVLPRRPAMDDLGAMAVPTLVLVAEQTRAHDGAQVLRAASERLASVRLAVLNGASHHSVPIEPPEQLNRELVRFFG